MDAVRPTFVIGIGEAGWRMIEDISQVAEEQLGDAAEAFGYAMIDTNEDMKQSDAIEVAHPIVIDKPSTDWQDDVEEFHYLSPKLEPLGSGDTGAMTQRPLGRYQVERQGQREDILDVLEDEIESHIEDVKGSTTDNIQTNGLSVWIVNSLGGGTGSGAFPIVTEVVKDLIEHRIDEDTYLFGIGGTPETAQGPGVALPLDDPEHRMNAYTAIKELLAVVEPTSHEGPVRYPESPTAPQDALSDDPFEKYFLLGHDPQEESKDKYLRQINRVAGALISYLSQPGGLEDFPFEDVQGEDDTLWAVDAHQIHAPVSRTGVQTEIQDHSLESAIEILETIEDEYDDIDDLRDKNQTARETRQYIRDLNPDERDWRVNRPKVLADGTSLNATFLSSLKDKAEDLTEEELTDEDMGFVLEDKIEELQKSDDLRTHLKGTVRETAFGHIIKFVYGTYLQQRIEHLQTTHQFYEEMKEELRDWARKGRIDVRNDDEPFGQFGSPLEAYDEAIRPTIDDYRKELRQKAADQGPISTIFSDDYEIKAMEEADRLDEYDGLREEYDHLETLRRDAETSTQRAWSELDALRQELDDEIEKLTNSIDEIREDITNELVDIKETLRRVQQRVTDDRYHQVPLTGLEEELADIDLDGEDMPEVVQNWYETYDSLSNLIREDQVSGDEISATARQVLDALDSPPIQDTDGNDVGTVVGMATWQGNRQIFLNHNINEQQTVSDVITQVGTFSSSDLVVESQDKFSVWLLGLYTNLSPEAMYEVAYFDEHFTDESRDVQETHMGQNHGDKVTDSKLAARFAYPEFLPPAEEDKIREKSGMGDVPAREENEPQPED